MKRRIFVGLCLSKKLQKKIFSFQKKYKILPVRWIKGKNLHLTLVPPWYVKSINPVKTVLGKLKGIKPATVEFLRITLGPSKTSPRLIWAEGMESKEILNLKTKIFATLKKKTEKRKFVPHITIARFKKEDFKKFPLKQIDEKIKWKETFESFFLLETHLKRSGAEYERLAEFKL